MMTNENIKYYFSYDKYLMEYGTFINPLISNEPQYYLKSVKEPWDKSKHIIALDIKGYANKGMTIEEDDLNEVANILFTHIQNRNIFFSSFDLMIDCEKWIFRKATIFKE